MNFFTNNLEIYQSLQIKLSEWVISLTEPGSQQELNFLLSDNSKKILVDTLPHENYQYRIFVKSTMLQDKRLKFKSWINQYPQDVIKVSKSTDRWLTGKHPYFREPNLYVKNKQTLSIVGLYIAGDVKKVEEFVPRNVLLQE